MLQTEIQGVYLRRIEAEAGSYVGYGDNQENMEAIKSNYGDFIEEMSEHMGTCDTEFNTKLTDLWDIKRHVIDSVGTIIMYNALSD